MKLHTIPVKYQAWLNARGISDEVLMHNNISVVNGQIVIPVYDYKGNFLFNKYRRDPFEDEGPKYRYDKGATAALYNIHNSWFPNDAVYICEGELDALALQSKGIFAVSTTGGSGTFDPSWAELLEDRSVYICYDNDAAGISGTIKLLKIFPHARVILIPQAPGMKDVTDFLKEDPSGWTELVAQSMIWRLPLETDSPEKKKIKMCVNSCSQISTFLGERRQCFLRDGRSTDFIDALLKHVTNRYDFYNQKLKYKPREYRSVGDAQDSIARARSVSITEYIQFNKQGDALCINHTDKHPSMHYFKKNNKVKCFPCGFNGDTIDVVMKLFNLTAGEAIKKINV